MEDEFNNFIKVWISVFVCILYCYSIGKTVPKGTPRLLCVIPVVCLFLYLPLNLSSIHLGGATAFFISWLGSFKLLLFASGKGPLALDPSISIGRFMVLACLPIEIQQNPPPKPQNPKFETNPSPSKPHQNGQNRENPRQEPQNPKFETHPSPPKSHLNGQNRENAPPKPQNPKTETKPSPSEPQQNGQNTENPHPKPQNPKIETNPSPPKLHLNGQNRETPTPKKTVQGHKSTLNHAIKGLLLAILIGVLDYSDHIHPKLMLVLHCLYIYLLLEILLAIVAVLARALLGLDLKPHFNEPYLSTSLQDFWGRRWNLMATSILRPAVYEPTLNFSTCVIGRKWAPLPSIMATFVMSGLMHELIYYYMGRVRPTWEVTWFFILQGACVTAEIVLKKALTGRRRLPRLISVVLTVGFVVVTCFWLFFPQFLRCKADVRMLEEYGAFAAFLNNVVSQRPKLLIINN